ncbi:MAG: Hydrolase (HAD superfamily) [Parcubacteria bacterium C7867-004]|nr:MAG: Hydrolase (HAD superfamily) [Parcubacteria bacterium C7867-004]
MKETKLPRETVEKALSLASLVLEFGQTNRVTHYPDGVTLESDTDHTVMLGIIACAFAKEHAPHLDTGKIAEFALVHDLVEVYAKDTPMFGMKNEAYTKDKEERESLALERIKREYDSVFPWIAETIEEYESLKTPEARFVKVFDKVLPKLVHILNRGVTVKSLGHTRQSTTEFHEYQYEKIKAGYGGDQPEALDLLWAAHLLSDEMLAELEPLWNDQ